MPIEQLPPMEAKKRMDEAADSVYLDVRTEMEFAQGHPAGALNVPIAIPGGPGGLQPNPEFIQVVEGLFPDKNQRIICGCQAGGRSQFAAELMARAGYVNLVNVDGGFGGRTANGRFAVLGWRDCGLPIENGLTEENGYTYLREKAGV